MKYILAVDIGGTTCKLAIFNRKLNIIEQWHIPSNTSHRGHYIIEEIVQSFKDHLSALEVTFSDCFGLGVGVPGPVDFEKGVVKGAVNLGWEGDVNLRERFESLTSVKTFIDNDANLAALGEQYKGAGKNHSHVVTLTLGTGVGGGIIVNRELYHGFNGAAGEIGHIKVDLDEKFQCNCGHKGCLETVASATGIVNMSYYYFDKYRNTSLAPLIESGELTSKDVLNEAKNKDELSLFVLNRVGYYAALAISHISVVINPSHFIIGGGVSQAGSILIDSIKSQYPIMTFPPAEEGVEIVLATLGNDAGINGAARLVDLNS